MPKVWPSIDVCLFIRFLQYHYLSIKLVDHFYENFVLTRHCVIIILEAGKGNGIYFTSFEIPAI